MGGVIKGCYKGCVIKGTCILSYQEWKNSVFHSKYIIKNYIVKFINLNQWPQISQKSNLAKWPTQWAFVLNILVQILISNQQHTMPVFSAVMRSWTCLAFQSLSTNTTWLAPNPIANNFSCLCSNHWSMAYSIKQDIIK